MQRVTAQMVIDAGRDYNPLFTKQTTPDAVALRRIAQYQQAVLAEIAEYRLDAVHVTQHVALPLVDFAVGIVLDEHLRLHGATVSYIDTDRQKTDLTIVEYPLRLGDMTDDEDPKAYRRADRLFLLGAADDWTTIAAIDIDLFPVGPNDIRLNDQLLLPGSPLRACAADLALFMASRTPNADAPAGAGGFHESYLDEVTERRRAVVGTIREDW